MLLLFSCFACCRLKQAFHQVSVTFHRTIAATANTIGIGILGLGTGPLLWNALAESIGRRPAYIISWSLYIPCTVWLARAGSYDSFAAARFLAGFTSSVSQTVPASLISETFQPEHRGAAIAAWTVLLIAGPVTAPVIGAGILTRTTDWRWGKCIRSPTLHRTLLDRLFSPSSPPVPTTFHSLLPHPYPCRRSLGLYSALRPRNSLHRQSGCCHQRLFFTQRILLTLRGRKEGLTLDRGRNGNTSPCQRWFT